MITLYQGPRAGGVPNFSPFCTKLELFLRANKIDYQLGAFNPFKAPKGKMPYITYKDGLLGDSQIIMETLARDLGIDMDAHLSNQQKATSHAVRRMLEEGTYFCGYYNRWAIDENWLVLKDRLFGKLPPPMKWILPRVLRKKALKSLHGQGVSRHSYEQIMGFAIRDQETVATLMGAGPFFNGERISSVDCTVYAFATAFFKVPMPRMPNVDRAIAGPMEAYCDRVKAAYFAEL